MMLMSKDLKRYSVVPSADAIQRVRIDFNQLLSLLDECMKYSVKQNCTAIAMVLQSLRSLFLMVSATLDISLKDDAKKSIESIKKSNSMLSLSRFLKVDGT